MNQDLLRVFETESDYDSAKPDFVYPTVSYVRDVDEVRYMEKSLLPMINTTGYATNFVNGQYYPQEALVFKAIYDMYSSYLNDDSVDSICIESGELCGRIWDTDNRKYQRFDIAYVGNEPLYRNYLIHFEQDGDEYGMGDIIMDGQDARFAQTSYNRLLKYSDGLCEGAAPA